MEENKVVEQNVVETETTQTSSPQVEVEKTTVPQTDEVRAEAELPDANEEQRKAFQELRLENKRLKDEMDARKKNESAFNAFRPKTQLQSFSSEQFTDPITGEVNFQALAQAQEASITAKVTTQIEERLKQQQDEDNARRQFPDLFADPEVEQEIADRWFSAKMRGEDLSVTDIANKVSKRFEKALTKAEKAGAERALEEIAPKEQAALSVSSHSPSQSARENQTIDRENKLFQVRTGSDEALAELMGNVPWANK